MSGCSTPGCTGSIVDGYCDVCGSPGSGGTTSTGMVAEVESGGTPAPASAGSAGPTASAPSVSTPAASTPAGSAAPASRPGPGRQSPGGVRPSATPERPGPPGRPCRPPARPVPSPAGRLATPPPRPTPRDGQAIANGTPCSQPGCPGRINTGYCDYCGAPAGAQAYTARTDDAELSTRTRGSMTLQSMALGSRLARGDGTVATRRVGSSSRRLRSARLGAGLTRVPPAPPVDPTTALMTDPVVPEDRRNCPSCGAEVGRSRDDVPGRTEGFCPHCRNPYSFDPKLQPGDLVAGQYEVAGCLAHGGLGWIYLARDKNVSDRWVVLKGLLNSGDADAMAAAIAEQQFLAQVEHPLIVEIYNFVTHEGAGYTVMEYVGGRSLKQLLKDRMAANGGAYDPLPVEQALAYILEALPAFQYLHDMGLLYCDFKPDNLIQVGDGIKLIDLGGVRRIDDHESAIYGTVGYQAPEVAELGPSIASDIHTIGRTLVVLVAEFRGYQSTWVDKLPGPDVLPVFAEHDSLYRLLMKCCAPDPADRFTSADELRVQLLGVLREVVAARTDGTALTSAASMLFEAPEIASALLSWEQLPSLRHDTSDPQYAWLANVSIEDPAERLKALDRAPEASPEVQLARIQCALDMGRPDLVEAISNDMLAADPWEWRAVWMTGLAALQHKDWARAQLAFNAVYGQVPGELAPKLALAVACEYGEEPAVAENLYTVCAGTDANYVAPSAFGLARIRMERGDVDGAVQALDLVPTTSRAYAESRRLRARAIMSRSSKDLDTLAAAMDSIAQVRLDPVERRRFTGRVLEEALAAVRKGGDRPTLSVGGHRATERALRDGLEETYRALSVTAKDAAERTALVDKANEIRRWTFR